MKQRQLWQWLAMGALAPILVLLEAWPWQPNTPVGWLLLITGSIPICIVVALGESVLSRDPVADKIDLATKNKQLSALRIGYLLAKFLCIIMLIAGACWVLARLMNLWHLL